MFKLGRSRYPGKHLPSTNHARQAFTTDQGMSLTPLPLAMPIYTVNVCTVSISQATLTKHVHRPIRDIKLRTSQVVALVQEENRKALDFSKHELFRDK